MAKLIENGVKPEKILMLTFTNKAAKEMLERANAMLSAGSNCSKIVASTYHSFCVKLIRSHAKELGLTPNFTILSPANSDMLFDTIKEENGYNKTKKFPSGKDLTSILSYSINKQLEVEDVLDIKFPKHKEFLSDIEFLFEEFKKAKKEQNLVDYDDLLVLTTELFDAYPNICKFYSNLYEYIMVDEYQDSNAIQLRLLKQLRQFGNDNICVVGDDQQSIYGFRGSIFKNIINFPKEFPGCKFIVLNDNYRSNQEILDLSNAILTHATEKYDKELIGLKFKNERPKLVRTGDQKSEAEFIFKQIWKYHMEGKSFKDMAVLIRTGSDSSFLEARIAQESARRKVPFRKFGGIKLFDKEISQNIIAFLTVLDNPNNFLFWLRILQLYPNIGPVYARKISQGIIDNGVEELLNPAYSKAKYGKSLPDIYDYYQKMRKKSLQEQLSSLINGYYYNLKLNWIHNSSMNETSKLKEERKLDSDIEEVKVFLSIAEDYSSTSSFLESLMLDATNQDDDGDYLTISTVHSVKGLEFDTVFILDGTDTSFPGERPLMSSSYQAIREHEAEIEEGRRLLYVAITRAKENLFITYPAISQKYGKVNPTELSRFLEDDYIYKDFCDIVYYR